MRDKALGRLEDFGRSSMLLVVRLSEARSVQVLDI